MSQGPFGTATPTSGLKPHRFVPRLISLMPSYSPVGASPSGSFPRCLSWGPSRTLQAHRGVAREIDGKLGPGVGEARARDGAGLLAYEATHLAPGVGHRRRYQRELAEQPERVARRERDAVYPRVDVASGSVGSVRTDPVDRATPTTRKAAPTGLAEYALGSRSCACAAGAHIRSATTNPMSREIARSQSYIAGPRLCRRDGDVIVTKPHRISQMLRKHSGISVSVHLASIRGMVRPSENMSLRYG